MRGPWKTGDRILVEAIVESVFDGVSNWPVKLLLDCGYSETIDASRNVHYSAIHPLSVIGCHDTLVKALEEIDTLAVCTGVVDPAQHRNMLENIARIARTALTAVPTPEQTK